jgi:hypothetical protein
MSDFILGRINFGPAANGGKETYTTLGRLIDDIAAEEELIEELCLFAGELLTEIEELKAQR